MTSSACDHWSGQSRNVESRPLGENGNHTPQTGSDQTWKCSNFNQKKSESVWATQAEAVTRNEQHGQIQTHRHLKQDRRSGCMMSESPGSGAAPQEKRSELQGAVTTDRECLRV